MLKSTFKVTKMDCPSEEQLIRMKLHSLEGIKKLEFNIPDRTLIIYHDGGKEQITKTLESLQLNSTLLTAQEVSMATDEKSEGQMLKAVLAINFSLFLIEIITGLIADSMGLIADSLDMLADAIVYGLSLYAVGKALTAKKQIAKISGYFQLSLAIFGFAEVTRRFLGFGETPLFQVMIIISVFALIGNLASLWLLQRSKNQEAHIKASWIFTSNDVLANIGVIVAGIMVYFTSSRYPDLIIGSIIFLMVARGSYKIMQLAK